MILKKNLIGSTQFVKILNTHVVICEENKQLFVNLGFNELFENDINLSKGTNKRHSANIKRVVGRKSSK